MKTSTVLDRPEFKTGKPIKLRISEVRQFYGISRTEVFRLKALGKIKTHKFQKEGNSRGVILVDAASLEAYINSFGPDGKEASV